MASTVLPNGIIIPEKYSRDWYNDLYHNWQELDNLLSASPGDGTLTIQKNGTTVGTFSANQATDETVNISVPTATSELTNDSGFITEDNTKIPLAGSNQISGDLIPATDNSIDIGSSTKNLKMLYTKGITIDGKTVDTDANGNMTYDGHIVDTIEEQGDGYIRYSNGIQICWGKLSITASSRPWGSLYETPEVRENYPKSFMSAPTVTAGSIGNGYCVIEMANGDAVKTPIFCAVKPTAFTDLNFTMAYIAIGRWK